MSEDKPLDGKLTQYGFEWGPLTVERSCSHKGTAVLTVKTPKGIIQIQSSPSGKTHVGVWSGIMANSYRRVAYISSKITGWKYEK